MKSCEVSEGTPFVLARALIGALSARCVSSTRVAIRHDHALGATTRIKDEMANDCRAG